MPKLAAHVEIGKGTLMIDGEEFPWYISERGPRVDGLASGDIGRVTVTIIAERVTVDHDIRPEAAKRVRST